MDFLSLIADALAIGGFVFALLAWVQARGTRRELARERARPHAEDAFESVDLAIAAATPRVQVFHRLNR